MNQNPNNPEYNPYAQPPSNPGYTPTPDARYGAQSGQTPHSAYNPSGPGSGQGYDSYVNPTVPAADPGSNPYNSYDNSYGSNAYAPPPPPLGGNATQYGPDNNPTFLSSPPPPPPAPMPNYASQPYQPTFPPPMPPMSPTPPPGRPGRGRTALISVIALVVIAVASIFGGVAYHNNQVTAQNNKNATATSQSATAQAQVQATGTAQSYTTATAVASTYPFFAHQTLNDTLADNSNKQAGWQTDSSCSFTGGTYQVVDDQKNTYISCMGLLTHYTNFTFQVDATMKQGNSQSGVGLYFRANSTSSQGYLFTIDQSGSYSVWISTDGTGTNSRTLKDGQVTTSQYTTGLFQKNTIAVVARGTQIAIYINQQMIYAVQDSTYASGQIGLLSVDITGKTVATFSNAKVWEA